MAEIASTYGSSRRDRCTGRRRKPEDNATRGEQAVAPLAFCCALHSDVPGAGIGPDPGAMPIRANVQRIWIAGVPAVRLPQGDAEDDRAPEAMQRALLRALRRPPLGTMARTPAASPRRREVTSWGGACAGYGGPPGGSNRRPSPRLPARRCQNRTCPGVVRARSIVWEKVARNQYGPAFGR